MTCTEKEAAEKWCPHYRLEHSAGNVGCGCIGSRCIQWRWFDPAAYPSENPLGDARRGYCGLAGEP